MESVNTSTTQPDVLASIRSWAPRELLSFLDQMLVFLPGELKYRLKAVMDSLPPEEDPMHKVLELVRSQWKNIRYQEDAQIAIVGPRQTGKSTLVRAISEEQTGSEGSVFEIVDIQGLDEYLGYDSERPLRDRLQHADVVLLVLDGRYGLTDSTVQMHERLKNLKRPVLVVLNKMDLVENPRRVVKEANRRLRTNVFAASAVQVKTIDKLLKAIVVTEPKALYPLAQNFPTFRRTICNGIVTQSSFASSVVSAIPIPVSDLLPITAIQTSMLLKIARAFGYRLNRERARELLPMLAAGVAVREGAHRLREHFPKYRDLIAVAIAGVWTFVLGHAAIQYFSSFAEISVKKEPFLGEKVG